MGCTPIKGANSSKCNPLMNKAAIIQDFADSCKQYKYKRHLGNGKYGYVFLAKSVETKEKVAVKALSKQSIPEKEVINEARILSKLNHPNIVKYINLYQTSEYSYLIMEYCKGEELFKKIAGKKLTEVESIKVMKNLLKAIGYCHSLNIIHSDLKPENIIYSPKGAVKVIDFGLSIKLSNTRYTGFAGTPYYIAPEIIKHGTYTKACDVWSLGIIMFIMLTGNFPINGNNTTEIFNNIEKFKEPDFNDKVWRGITEKAKDLLKKLLNTNPNTRITVSEALEHKCFALN